MTSRFAVAMLLAAGLSTSAQAGLISGNYNLTNGNAVALQGLEWMPFTYTAGLSRDKVEAGFTDNFGNVWGAGEWQYATKAQAETLLGSLWDQTYNGWSSSNAIGASWFLDTFGGLQYDEGYGTERISKTYSDGFYKGLDSVGFYFGATGECNADVRYGCIGKVSAMENSGDHVNTYNVKTGGVETMASNNGALGYFSESFGVNMGVNSLNSSYVHARSSSTNGSLLVRVAPAAKPNAVSESSSLGVLATGLMILLFRLRRSAAK